MKVGFLLVTASELRTLGRLIDECIKAGIDTYVFIATKPVSNLKKRGMVFLNRNTIPKFEHGDPFVIEVENPRDFYIEVNKCHISTLFFHMGVSSTNGKPIEWLQIFNKQKCKVKKICLASHFYDNCLLPLESYNSFDKVIILSHHSKEVHYDVLLSKKYRKHEIDRVFKEKCIVGGSPLFDNLLSNHDTRQHSEKVLLLSPSFFPPFQRTVLLKSYKKKSLINLMRYPYKENILNYYSNISFLDLLISIRDYCNNKNKLFHSKSRFKDDSYYKEHLSELCDYHYNKQDCVYYPYTQSQKMIKNSGVMIATRSFSVMEAVALGTPALNIQQPFNDRHFKKLDPKGIFRKRVRGDFEGSLVNFPGCVRSVDWSQLHLTNINEEIEKTINMYSEDSRQNYIKKYINPWSGKNSSQKIIESVL
jgi:hypothetical protein